MGGGRALSCRFLFSFLGEEARRDHYPLIGPSCHRASEIPDLRRRNIALVLFTLENDVITYKRVHLNQPFPINAPIARPAGDLNPLES